ncbi:MAG TPA: ATP synthase subunit F [Thermoanaerobacterales bacterium]|jgi:V/A-type H+-transporting ATPase subunit F|nr:ATP synthase subunit F [Thermoanaerobacterales bacterium]
MKVFLLSDNTDTLVGFRLAGIEGILVNDKDDALRQMKKLQAAKDIGLLLITEKLAEKIKDEINRLKLENNLPIIIEVPDRHGSRRPPDYLTRYIRQTIGLKI